MIGNTASAIKFAIAVALLASVLKSSHGCFGGGCRKGKLEDIFPRLLMLNLLPLQCTANGAIGGHGRRALPPAVEALKLQPGVQFNRHFGDFPKPVPNPVWSFETCKL